MTLEWEALYLLIHLGTWHHLAVWDSLSLNLECTKWLDWLANKPQGFFCFYPPSSSWVTHLLTQLFWCWGSNLGPHPCTTITLMTESSPQLLEYVKNTFIVCMCERVWIRVCKSVNVRECAQVCDCVCILECFWVYVHYCVFVYAHVWAYMYVCVHLCVVNTYMEDTV